MEEEIRQMAEGARPEEFDVDLHEMRKRALNRLPNQDSMELPLSDEERRDIDLMTSDTAREVALMGEGAREEEYGVSRRQLNKRHVLKLPKEGAGVELELSEEEAREIESVVHPK